eukprot:150932_1
MATKIVYDAIRKYSHKIATQHTLSKSLEELCYTHLLYGQYKQQSFSNWLNTTQPTRNWNISPENKLLTLNPGSTDEINVPMKCIGTHNRESNVFQWMDKEDIFSNQSVQSISHVLEFQTESQHNCGDHFGYILSSIIVSILNSHGYYVGFGLNSDEEDPNMMVFVLLNELPQFVNYQQSKGIDTDVEVLMNCWDYTFNHLLPKSNVNLTDNLKIFDHLFKHYHIQCTVQHIPSNNHSKLLLGDNTFNVKCMEFEANGEFYSINDLVISDYQ